MRLSAQITLGCAKLKIKANYHTGFYIAPCLYSIFGQSYSFIKHPVERLSKDSNGGRKRVEAVYNYSTILRKKVSSMMKTHLGAGFLDWAGVCWVLPSGFEYFLCGRHSAREHIQFRPSKFSWGDQGRKLAISAWYDECWTSCLQISHRARLWCLVNTDCVVHRNISGPMTQAGKQRVCQGGWREMGVGNGMIGYHTRLGQWTWQMTSQGS